MSVKVQQGYIGELKRVVFNVKGKIIFFSFHLIFAWRMNLQPKFWIQAALALEKSVMVVS